MSRKEFWQLAYLVSLNNPVQAPTVCTTPGHYADWRANVAQVTADLAVLDDDHYEDRLKG